MTEKCCERFFELPVECYCGLYIREDAAKKLQKILSYYDRNSRGDVPQRIALFDKANRLKYVPDVFKTDLNFLEAIKDVRAFYEEHYGPDNPPEGGDAT